MSASSQIIQKKTIADVFVEGALKGWNIGVKSTVPNVLMAFAVIAVLKITGFLDLVPFSPLSQAANDTAAIRVRAR